MLLPLVESIRKRMGLPEEAPKASEFIDNEYAPALPFL
jgi:hypothetical protein